MKSLRKSTASTAVKKISPLAKKTTVKLPGKTDSIEKTVLGITLTVPDGFPLDIKNLKISTMGNQFIIEIPDITIQGNPVQLVPIPRPRIDVELNLSKKVISTNVKVDLQK